MTAPYSVLGRPLAYASKRAVDRKSTKGAVAHVVMELTLATGLALPDSECGALGYIPLGEWDPDYAHNCKECVKVLRGGELPEVKHVEPAVESSEPELVPFPVQLSLFDAA